jgi:hypothetical protein
MFAISPVFSYAGWPDNPWAPILPLNRTDADVSIFILAQNGVSYTNPVKDPWFLADRFDRSINKYRPIYLFDTIGCTEQYRICNPVTQECTPYIGIWQLREAIEDMSLNDLQYVSARRLVTAGVSSSMSAVVGPLGSSGMFPYQLPIMKCLT